MQRVLLRDTPGEPIDGLDPLSPLPVCLREQ